MGKFTQDLKKGFLHMVESIKACKTGRGHEEEGEEPKLESAEKLRVRDRAIHIKVARGPKRPSLPKGPPPQTDQLKS
ncbi:hypothetical protein I3843_04G084800 [Carya illinoinensis]|uniref:Uncharacterized protein n=1 Tax=Carya illinoinensis TaxID=32201 RepID=A0A8T1QSM2_CARIL|nr:hypothetical protein CIPAW_04G092200 [Carya illinoinensis]KAG7983052.1 hypothetical protein I3843_04G084800 [Carya illinoinensis]